VAHHGGDGLRHRWLHGRVGRSAHGA
jgi:hypothetical protein